MGNQENRSRPSRRAFLAGLGLTGAAAVAAPAFARGRATAYASEEEDRAAEDNIVFPADTFAETANDVGVLNVKTLFGAKGDGVSDDTEAMIAAYDTVVSRWKAARNSPSASQNIIYLPNGVYRVTNTIVYSGPPPMNGDSEDIARVRFQGQSRTGVVIKLADEAEGYDGTDPKPVLSFAKTDWDNVVSSNYVQNLTIDTGKGNLAAVGILFQGANNSGVRDVTIRSADGSGKVGLAMPVGPSHCFHENVTINGFDRAVEVTSPFKNSSIAMEHMQISGQNVAGLSVMESPLCVRDLTSSNSVPAAELSDTDGMLTILDSTFIDGEGALAAIKVAKGGHLFARNVYTAGYQASIVEGDSTVKAHYVAEHVSDAVETLFDGQPAKSLDLAIKDVPHQPWPSDLNAWENVHNYGAKGDGTTDDSAAIQKAMDSGKSVIYFQPGHVYAIENTVTIPATVERVVFMYVDAIGGAGLGDKGSLFDVAGSAANVPLVMERFVGWSGVRNTTVVVNHGSTRTLILQDMHHQQIAMYQNSVPGADVHVKSASCRTGTQPSSPHAPGFTFQGQNVWIRFCDPEISDPELLNVGGVVWILGAKTEGRWTSFATRDGGKMEILSAILNVQNPSSDTVPIISNDNSSVSARLATYNGVQPKYGTFDAIVTETRGSQSRTLWFSDIPDRQDGLAIVLPLYVGTARG